MKTLVSGNFSCGIEEKGAELRSFKKNGIEYMWQADPAYWGRTAPVLFPFVGAVADGVYRYNGTAYPMGQHGFARDMLFTLKEESEDRVLYRLESNAETLKKYPLPFALEIGYTLQDSVLNILWRVVNTGNTALYFSIGAHPAFNCTLKGSVLRLSKNGTPVTAFENAVFGKGLLTDKKEKCTFKDGIAMDEHTFDGDAFVIEDSQVDAVELIADGGARRLKVAFDAPVVGLWSPPHKNAPFVCIEPWYGRADKEGFTGELCEREWGNTLAAGETFEANYTMEIL